MSNRNETVVDELRRARKAQEPQLCPRCHKLPSECSVLPFLLSTRSESAAWNLAEYWHDLEDSAARKGKQDGSEAVYRMQKLGVPSQVLLSLRGPLRPTAALEAAKKFARAQDATLHLVTGEPAAPIVPFLLLLGNRGVGKTVAAAYALREAVQRIDWESVPSGPTNEPCMWVSAREVTQREAFGAVEEEWLSKLRRCGMLVVDDLGDETTERGLAAFKSLMFERVERRRRTVLTSNLRAAAFRERYSDALADRISDASIAPDLAKQKNLRGAA